MHTPPPGLLAFGWMPGTRHVGEVRDDSTLVQSLRDLSRSAADDPDTLQPPLDDADLLLLQMHQPAMPSTSHPAPAVVEFQEAPDSAPAHDARFGWSSKAQATRRLAVSIALVLGLFGMVLALDYFHFGRQGHSATPHAIDAAMSQMQEAIAQRDSEQQALAQAQRRELLQDAARRASLALGLEAPVHRDPEPPRPDDAVQIVGAMTATPAAVPTPAGECNAALVALSLCQPTNTTRGPHAP